ncbi:MAG: hypothetical protein AB7E70_03060 [Hyphomicrobiaceae bacterium]
MPRAKLELLEMVLARLGATAEMVHVHADHLERWPSECVDELKRARLFQDAGEVGWVECRRCTQRCHRPVERVPARTTSAGYRHFTTCELRNDVSIVEIRPDRLRRWRASRSALCRFVADQLGLRIARADYETGRVIFQSKRFGRARVAVAMIFDEGRVLIRLDNESRPLNELVLWDRGPPRVNRQEVECWAGEVAASRLTPIGTVPSRLKQTLRKHRFESRNARWQALARQFKSADPSRKKSDIAEEIFRTGKWPGVTSSRTVERVIRLPK